MHSSQLVELAATVSAQGSALLRGGEQLLPGGIDAYWLASKCRLDRWSRRLKQRGAARGDEGAKHDAARRSLSAACQEILTSEILTRVWTGLLAAADRRHGSEFEPIGRSIFVGHLEARRRVLGLIASSDGLTYVQCRNLNQLRRVCERWSDLLLAPLAGLCDVTQLAHDPARALDFAQDHDDDVQAGHAAKAQAISAASLQSTFGKRPFFPTFNADVNADIAVAVLACFPADSISSTANWLWHARLLGTTADAERLLAGLLTERI